MVCCLETLVLMLWPTGTQGCMISAHRGRDGTGWTAANGTDPETGGRTNGRAPETAEESEGNMTPGEGRDR